MSHWKNTFKSWPSLEKSWPVWYKRISASKQAHWDAIGIGQALALTIANSAKDEPLLAAATYFWSNTLNAFLFNQGPMTPTLLDIIMLTGLDVTSSANPMNLNTKNTFEFKTKSIGGWSGYIAAYMGKGPVTPREHVAFLLMWLEKFLFCGFYEGFQKDARVWFFYADSMDLELPADFRFEDINHEKFQQSREVFTTAISPCILPVGIHQGRNIQVSYEFYHPMSSARQLGMGQLPIGLYFVDKIQCRGDISSTLMMDRLLNIPGPPLGNIENIKLARFRSRAFDRWWSEWKLHLFHQSASMYMTDLFPDAIPQTTESSPPRRSNSGKDIEYAPSLIPNGGGRSPSAIGYNAPKTSALLQGLIRQPADAGEKRKTRSSAVDTLAPALKKKTKPKKSTPADDLPALDPSIEQALDEEAIEEDVDQAAAEVSDTERTPSASPKQAPPSPSVPAHFSRPPPPPSPPVQPESGKRTPSAADSHHVEEEEQLTAPAIPVLADLFSFDIKDYLDETEEDTTSKATALLPNDVKRTLEDISHRLGASLDTTWQRLADHWERKDIEATIQHNRQLVHIEKSKLDQLSEGPIKSNIDRLEARKIELLAQLQECNAELDIEHKKLVDLPQAVEEQKAKLKSAIKNVADMTKSLKVIPGTDAQDTQAIEEIEQIRKRAIPAIQ
uniref:Aminotransferase-like plant mobile domain-containing protein n=1 Tax=Oryza sativa subsp. japonica TaxID=39947 RepID=Q53NJ4_ORYSJ|nr:hypothetical protein LOC_Os11g08620 [Oryza sativa Japonica Group]